MGFDPATLAIAATVASTVVSGVGAFQQSQAASASAGYNAKVAQQNAEIATKNAEFTAAEGNQNVAAAGAATRAKVAATVANQAGSGVDINTGSSVDVRESEAKLGMLNALNVRSQATRQAYGFQVGASSDMAQSQLLRSQQKSEKVGGYLNAAGTVLGGIGKASMYGDYLNSNDPTAGLTKIVGNGFNASEYAGGQ